MSKAILKTFILHVEGCQCACENEHQDQANSVETLISQCNSTEEYNSKSNYFQVGCPTKHIM